MNLKKTLVGIFIVVILGLVYGVFFYDAKSEEYQLGKLGDMLTGSLRGELKRQKDLSVSLALALANNEALSALIRSKDRQKAGFMLDNTMESFENYDWPSKFWIQIATPDFRVFLRSWDKSTYDDSLESIRKGLVIVKNSEKPFTSIELGKKLNIKAIVPIMHSNEYVGSLEVIKNFDEMVGFFKSKGVALFVLMDNKHLNIAEWMVDYPTLGEFVICHREYDKAVYEELRGENIYARAGYKTALGKNYFLAFEPLRDMDGQRLGFFVLAIPKDEAIKLSRTPDKLSFFTNYSKDEIAGYYQDDKTKPEQKSETKKERKYGEIR